jgi:hypothetical protein
MYPKIVSCSSIASQISDMTYRLRDVGVYVSILQGKGHSCPEAPATIEHIDSPKSPNCICLLLRIREECCVGVATVQP